MLHRCCSVQLLFSSFSLSSFEIVYVNYIACFVYVCLWVGEEIYESSHGPVCAINASQTETSQWNTLEWLVNRGQLSCHPSVQFELDLLLYKHIYTVFVCVHPSKTFISYINCYILIAIVWYGIMRCLRAYMSLTIAHFEYSNCVSFVYWLV